jgi:nitroimidazol reductase NimA-like FMN-containing flavoprotein (pyridoxamine 5'-phosphate oxidase superfamily)
MLDNIKKDLKNLFLKQRLGVLATQKNGQPYTSLVAFTTSEDLKYLYFATTRSTRKYDNLSRDPRVSMLIDNRSNSASDFKQATSVTATGTSKEVDAIERDAIQGIYLEKHPYLSEFVHSPSCAILGLEVNTYFVVTHFQNVIEIHMKP